MSLNRFRNQPCPCGSGMKFKYCHLQEHYDKQKQVATPIQKKEGQKAATYWRKRYKKITTKPLDEPLMTRDVGGKVR
jgi:hypothetical protein